jgi:hypothetical protein
LSKRLPVRAAAADWAVMDADHSIAPNIGYRLPRDAHLFRGKIGDTPGKAATQ